jgi:hypothetical protein
MKDIAVLQVRKKIGTTALIPCQKIIGKMTPNVTQRD